MINDSFTSGNIDSEHNVKVSDFLTFLCNNNNYRSAAEIITKLPIGVTSDTAKVIAERMIADGHLNYATEVAIRHPDKQVAQSILDAALKRDWHNPEQSLDKLNARINRGLPTR